MHLAATTNANIRSSRHKNYNGIYGGVLKLTTYWYKTQEFQCTRLSLELARNQVGSPLATRIASVGDIGFCLIKY